MFKREWFCKSSNIHYGQTVAQKPDFPQSSTCPECAIKMEGAKLKEIR